MGSDRKPIAFEHETLKIRVCGGGRALRYWFECHVIRCNPSRKTAVKIVNRLFSMAKNLDEGTLSSVSLCPFFKIEGGKTT